MTPPHVSITLPIRALTVGEFGGCDLSHGAIDEIRKMLPGTSMYATIDGKERSVGIVRSVCGDGNSIEVESWNMYISEHDAVPLAACLVIIADNYRNQIMNIKEVAGVLLVPFADVWGEP